MQRSFTFVFLLIVLFVCVGPLAAQDTPTPEPVGLRPDAPEYALHGPYWVGTQEFVIDPGLDRPLPVTVWYPALNAEDKPEEVVYEYNNFVSIEGFSFRGNAIANAVPATVDAPYPLVIISHGTAQQRYSLAYLAEHLASYGFVVLAADHTGNTLATSTDPQVHRSDFSGFFEGHAAAMATRPGDIQRQIDFAQALSMQGNNLTGMVDGEQIAVVGHSYGGFTALAAAGGRVNLGPTKDWCDENRNNPAVSSHWVYALVCYYVLSSEESTLASLGMDANPGEMWPPYHVEGVDAIVPISPGGEITPEGLAEVEIPALFIVGDGDTVISPEIVMAQYEMLGSTHKGLAVLENADHFFPMSDCIPWFVEHQATGSCGGDPVWDINRAHDLINHFTTAFLLDSLKGDEAAQAALAPEAVAFPGVEYQAEGF